MSEEWSHASWVSTLGKWAWLLVILNGVLEIIFSIVNIGQILYWNSFLPPFFQIPIPFWDIWNLIWGIIIILIAIVIIRPKFSNKCAAKDWDSLYNWAFNLG